ncbi:Dirigent protein [Sesbania bispinosa]|nr:Dirigent protein [Sesbania bispinosa]
MFPRIIFCTAVSLATLAVILLALLSPVSHKKSHSRPWLDLSLYIQQPHISTSNTHLVPKEDAEAFIFHRVLTEGPEKTSRVVGKAQGFIIPVEQFQQSAFNVLYLTFDTPGHSGSISVQAMEVPHKDREEFRVVGGTGSFAFARGVAFFTQTDGVPSEIATTYHVKLQLEFPNHSSKLR